MPSYTYELIVLPSAVRAVTTYSADFINESMRAASFWLDITAVPGVVTVALGIQGKDPISGNYVTVSAGANQAGVGTTITQFLGTAVGIRIWRAVVTHSGAGNFTYSVGASLGGA